MGMQDFEEHVPDLLYLEHKRIGDERCWDIGDMGCSQHGVGPDSRRIHMQWRDPGVDADRPDVTRCHQRPLSVRHTRTRRLHQTVDFRIGKAGHFTGFAGNADRHLVGCPFLTGPTEVEQLVNVVLKI